MADLGAHVSEQHIITVEERPHVGNRLIATAQRQIDLVARLRALTRYDWNGEPDANGQVFLVREVLEVLDGA